jgi:hypothetical protein
MTDRLPIGCAARWEEIHRRGRRLLRDFINGNRNDTFVELVKMDNAAGLAVLSVMMKEANKEVREDLYRYFTEVA